MSGNLRGAARCQVTLKPNLPFSLILLNAAHLSGPPRTVSEAKTCSSSKRQPHMKLSIYTRRYPDSLKQQWMTGEVDRFSTLEREQISACAENPCTQFSEAQQNSCFCWRHKRSTMDFFYINRDLNSFLKCSDLSRLVPSQSHPGKVQMTAPLVERCLEHSWAGNYSSVSAVLMAN